MSGWEKYVLFVRFLGLIATMAAAGWGILMFARYGFSGLHLIPEERP